MKLRASYQEVSQRYKADVLTVRQHANSLQCELEIKSHADSVSQDQHLMQNLRAEQDTVCQKMAEERQQNAAQQEKFFAGRAGGAENSAQLSALTQP